MYECPRCGYTTNQITNFRKHINTKVICQPLINDISLDILREEMSIKKQREKNTFECECCKKKYATPETLRVHKKKCKVVNLPEEVKGPQNNNIIINAQQNNIINVDAHNVNDFLNENMDFITDEFKIRCASKLNNGLIDFIKSVRFNPEHPENMNIQVHRIKHKTLYVLKNHKWEVCDAKWTLEEMIIHGARVLHQTILTHFDQEKLLDNESFESRIQQWLLTVIPNNNEKIMGILSKRLYAMILNNQLLLMEKAEE